MHIPFQCARYNSHVNRLIKQGSRRIAKRDVRPAQQRMKPRAGPQTICVNIGISMSSCLISAVFYWHTSYIDLAAKIH